MSNSPTGVGITCGRVRLGTLKGPTAGGTGDWPFCGKTKLADLVDAELLPVGIPTALARD